MTYRKCPVCDGEIAPTGWGEQQSDKNAPYKCVLCNTEFWVDMKGTLCQESPFKILEESIEDYQWINV